MFIQQLVKTNMKGNTKAPHYCPLRESTGERRIPLTKGQWCGKRLHLMSSSLVIARVHPMNTFAHYLIFCCCAVLLSVNSPWMIWLNAWHRCQNKCHHCHNGTKHNKPVYIFHKIHSKYIFSLSNYSDVIMSPTAFQITGIPIVCSTVYSGANQRRHQSSASLAFVRGIHWWPVDSPPKGPVIQKMFSFDDVIMIPLCFSTWSGSPTTRSCGLQFNIL